VISLANQELCFISGHLTRALRARSGTKERKEKRRDATNSQALKK
jgi:hypothetical protein